jgi:hypothetical protein
LPSPGQILIDELNRCPRRVKRKPREKTISQTPSAEYGGLIGGIAELLEAARRTAARTVNALMTATYWEIGPAHR